MDSTYSIEVNNLTKKYGDTIALSNVNFQVKQNELFGLIGPDGAGKTTLFRTIVTLLLPDEGSVIVEGMDVVSDYKNLRKCIGYMPGNFSLYYDLSVEENLAFFASIFGTSIEENYDLVKKIYSHIEPFKKRKAGALSGGMKQKLALSCALIHKPKVLVLDEPTTGVDAISRREFWTLLQELKKDGITIIVSTPYMDEAEMCDRIALIHQGNIFSIDTPKKMVKKFAKPLFVIQSENNYKLSKLLMHYDNTFSAYIFGHDIHYVDKSNDPDIYELTSFMKKNNIQASVSRKDPTIEDYFIEAIQTLKHE